MKLSARTREVREGWTSVEIGYHVLCWIECGHTASTFCDFRSESIPWVPTLLVLHPQYVGRNWIAENKKRLILHWVWYFQVLNGTSECFVWPRKIRSTGIIASTRIHKRKTSSLSLHSHRHLRSLLQLSPFTRRQHYHSCPAKCRPPNWISDSCFWSSQVLCLARRRSQCTPSSHRQGALRDPWLTTTTPATAAVDPLTLRQNWSARAKWHSTLTGTRATNRFTYFAAAASWLSMQSGGRWHDQDRNSRVVTQVPSKEEEEEDLGQGDTTSGSFGPAHRGSSLPETEVITKNIDDFLTLLHAK